MTVSHRVKLGIGVRYPKPSSIGADRLANAVAAAALHELPAVVVDLGTAISFDVLSADAEYLGGAIAPGIRTSADTLFIRIMEADRPTGVAVQAVGVP